MNKYWPPALMIALSMFSLTCMAMSARESVTFNDASAAFVACRNQQGVHVLQNGKIVCLRGKIDPTMFIDLARVRDQIAPHPYVIVSGPGGLEDAAIYIVRLLDKQNPIPVSGDMCASACAQFLFLMGNERVMLHCADVAMHGGPGTISDELKLPYSDQAKMTAIAADWRFIKFYKHRNISLDMVTKPPAAVQKKLDAGQVVFWPWSINQLRAFGVKGIISQNDPDRVVPADYGKVCIKPLPPAVKGSGA